MHLNRIVLILTFLVNLTLGFSQDIEFSRENFKDKKDELKEALKNIEKGDVFLNLEPYYFKNAIPFYLDAYKLNPNNSVLNYQLGKAYLYSNFKDKAIDFLVKALQLNPQVAPDINLYLGMGYHIDMQWDKSIEAFNKHLAILHPKDETGVREEIQIAINGTIYEANFGATTS